MSDALDRAIGRLVWVGIRGDTPQSSVLQKELEICERSHVGGIILFDVDVPIRDANRRLGMDEKEARLHAPRNIRSPEQLRELVVYIRERLGSHVVISVDQEGGHVSRLHPSRGFVPVPSAYEYARANDERRKSIADTIAQMLAEADIDINLAPCVDVCINPNGPGHTALGRSFASDSGTVIQMASEQISALHRHGVAATLKHFPGHGSAVGDTHAGMVDITATWKRDIELEPYAVLIQSDTAPDAIMVAHLVHVGIDPEMPASLSPQMIGGLLRTELGWNGLVITDSLDMRAISDRFGPGEASVQALLAGADVALEANNLSSAKPCPAGTIASSIRAAVQDGRIREEAIHASVERIGSVLQHRKTRAAAGRKMQ